MKLEADIDELNIILAGFMATGKTAVGKILAEKLGRSFIDLDQVIEEAAQKSIREIFEHHGEAYFRDLESEAIASLDFHPPGCFVLSTGGGALGRKKNRTILKNNGLLILLTATPETILERVSKTGERPLLNGSDPAGKIKALLEKREKHYSICDFSFDTTAKSIDQVAEEILATLSVK